jgi:hypothetical protein
MWLGFLAILVPMSLMVSFLLPMAASSPSANAPWKTTFGSSRISDWFAGEILQQNNCSGELLWERRILRPIVFST